MPSPGVLESITITGGYLRDARLEFADGLNCIIGGRGSGKTTVMELLRFTFEGLRSPSRREDSTRAAPVKDAFVRDILGSGRVTVRVRTALGVRYEVTRAVGEPTRLLNDQGALLEASLESDLFRLEIVGQSQMEAMAVDKAAQLSLLDRFAESVTRRLGRALAEVERALEANAAWLTRLERAIANDEDQARELSSVEEAMRALERLESPIGEEATRARLGLAHRALRGRERAALSDVEREMERLRTEVEALQESASRRAKVSLDDAIVAGPNGALMQSIGADLSVESARVQAAIQVVRQSIQQAEAALRRGMSSLDQAHARQELELTALLSKHEEDTARAAERTRLEARYLELSSAARRLTVSRGEAQAARGQRADLLKQLLTLRQERFCVRETVAQEVTAALRGDVRVSVEESADVDAYEALLTETLRGANIRPASFVRDLARAIRPEDLAQMAQTGDTHSIVALDDSKSAKVERATRILDAIVGSGRAYDLEVISVEDVPHFELRTGAVYKPSAAVSTGQRCTCILPLLLLRGSCPLLIDQPEDNLDNAFIYDVLVKSVATVKQSRQLIFVTHNPNIPVLGDADRVFVLESDGSRGAVTHTGTVDALREPIERILEGGREAFLKRGLRYGHSA
jgi:hypothetical protein